MPILILIILVILVAQIGFWDTFTAILGAVGVIILLLLLAGALVVLTALYFLRRVRARYSVNLVTPVITMPDKATKKKKAPPAIGADELVTFRVAPATLRSLDRWAKRLDLTRSEAIRRLLKAALRASRTVAKLKMTPLIGQPA